VLPVAAYWPFPLRSVYRLMSDPDFAAVVRGDGSRRRCAEVRAGLRTYRRWLQEPEAFAIYLWAECRANEYPIVEWSDYAPGSLAYDPPPLTVAKRDLMSLSEDIGPTLRLMLSSAEHAYRARASRKNKHLRSGEMQRHVVTRLRKGHRPARIVRGERAPNVSLREEQVLELRRMFHGDGCSRIKLAKLFGVSTTTIAQIVSGATWKHLPLDGGLCAEAQAAAG
jgi:hypothetical protein